MTRAFVVPGTEDAQAKGCVCPDLSHLGVSGVLLVSGGHYFDPKCPVHRNAVLAEVQRIFGAAQ